MKQQERAGGLQGAGPAEQLHPGGDKAMEAFPMWFILARSPDSPHHIFGVPVWASVLSL